ncbi:hypothetical protein ACWDGI_28575 [Streptomyces sp. NPDC001220]
MADEESVGVLMPLAVDAVGAPHVRARLTGVEALERNLGRVERGSRGSPSASAAELTGKL